MTIWNGKLYTQTDNDQLEALAFINLTAYESRVLSRLRRDITGFGKSKRWLAWEKLERETGLHRRNISKAINGLIKKGIIYEEEANIYGLQENITLWKGLSVEITQAIQKEITQKTDRDNLKLSQEITIKETLKERIKRKVFSKLEEEENEKTIQKGLDQFAKAIGILPKEKKKNNYLRKKDKED